jgi:hypothetical protein
MSDYDSPWREALDVYLPLFLAFFFPRAYADIDWSRGYETPETELQQVVREAALGPHRADKLVKVWLRDGQESWILIHVEVQSQEEVEFPRRMFTYNTRIFDLYNRTVVSLAVLGDDRAGWRPNRFRYGRWGCNVGIRFPVVKLLDYAADVEALEANPNPFAALVLAHLKTMETRHDPNARRVWKVRLIKGLYERGLSKQDVGALFRIIDWIMDLPKAAMQQFGKSWSNTKRRSKCRTSRAWNDWGWKRESRRDYARGSARGSAKGCLKPSHWVSSSNSAQKV